MCFPSLSLSLSLSRLYYECCTVVVSKDMNTFIYSKYGKTERMTWPKRRKKGPNDKKNGRTLREKLCWRLIAISVTA